MLKGDIRKLSIEPPDPDDNDDLLTDEDLFAILCRDGMGGYNGLTWEQYCSTPDHVLRDSYLAERDEDHTLVTYRQRRRQRREVVTGRPECAGRELPKREDLKIPPEAWEVDPVLARTPFGQVYVLMYWQIWRRRQAEKVRDENGEAISEEYILKRWKAKATGGVSGQHGRQKHQPKTQD